MGLNDILSKLNEINFEDTVNVFIPSLQRTVSFKPLSLQQQKEILKSGISSEIFNLLEFNVIFNAIIDQNSLEKNNYRLLDKPVIAFALRNKFTSQLLESEDKQIDTKIFIDKKLNVEASAFEDFFIEEGPLKITAQAPNIAIDQVVSKMQLGKIKKASNIDLTNIIGEMYVFEVLKYIKTIQIGELQQDMSLLTIEDRLKLIEQLPASIITKLNTLIAEKFKNPEEEYLTVEGVKLTLDARLFV
jgi:hypothetical protein